MIEMLTSLAAHRPAKLEAGEGCLLQYSNSASVKFLRRKSTLDEGKSAMSSVSTPTPATEGVVRASLRASFDASGSAVGILDAKPYSPVDLVGAVRAIGLRRTVCSSSGV
jgi:hypothetical protein